MIRSIPIAALAALTLVSCGTSDEPEEQVSPSNTPKLVGRVASVNLSDGFVLIEGYGEVVLGRDLLLTTVGDEGRAATLSVSGERMGQFAAADIKAGEIKAGDAVYARPLKEEEPDFLPEPPQDVPPKPHENP